MDDGGASQADERRRRRDGRRGRRLPAEGARRPQADQGATGVPEIVLEPTADILAGLGARGAGRPVLVGFAAETDDSDRPRPAQARAKRVDLMVVNDVSAPGVGLRPRHQRGDASSTRRVPDEVPLSAKAVDGRRGARTAVVELLRRALTRAANTDRRRG